MQYGSQTMPSYVVPALQASAAASAATFVVWSGVGYVAVQSRNDCPRPFECPVWQVPPSQQPVPAQQLPPQVSGVGPPHTHVPPEQVRPGPQALPHAPQFASFVRVSMQVPEQFVVPEGQHFPLEQLGVAPVHTAPQPLQFAGSFWKFTHPATPQSSGNEEALQPQVPPEQVARGGQWRPQVPQFQASTSVLTHCPVPGFPQSVATPVQTHVPATHVASDPGTPAPWQTSPH